MLSLSKYLTVSCILILSLLFSSNLHSSEYDVENEVLNAAEGFFIALKEKRFADVWESLTSKSRDTIVSEVFNEINKKEARIGKEVIKEDFYKNGELARLYWNAFLKNFDPDIVLGKSVWNIGKIKADTAKIILKYEESEYNSELKLYKEDGRWHVGLVESFWTMKRYIK
jgi:hypothetical protein